MNPELRAVLESMVRIGLGRDHPPAFAQQVRRLIDYLDGQDQTVSADVFRKLLRPPLTAAGPARVVQSSDPPPLAEGECIACRGKLGYILPQYPGGPDVWTDCYRCVRQPPWLRRPPPGVHADIRSTDEYGACLAP